MQVCAIAALLTLSLLLLLQQSAEAADSCTVNPQEIVDFHNYLRRNVVPPAGDINALQWDPQLAIIAQNASDTCVFEHNYGGIFTGLGENLYLGHNCDFKKILVFMYLEREMYNISTKFCDKSNTAKYPFFGTCGHYLQLVSAPIINVGCAITKCGNNYLAACEYNRPYTDPPYEPGTPGTKCGHMSTGYSYDKLCYSKIHYMPQAPAGAELECKIDCLNGGTRVPDMNNGYECRCQCPPGFVGIRCERNFGGGDVSPSCAAQAVTCENGGVPTMQGDVCKCVCPSGFRGDRCQEDIVAMDNSLFWHFGLKKRYSSYYPVEKNIMSSKYVDSAIMYYFTNAVNSYCKQNFSICCPESGNATTDKDFVNMYSYYHTPGFPTGSMDGSLKVGVYYTMVDEFLHSCNLAITPLVNRNALVKAANATGLNQVKTLLSSIDPLFSIWVQ